MGLFQICQELALHSTPKNFKLTFVPSEKAACSKWPTHTQQKARAHRDSFKRMRSLSHGESLHMPPCTHKRGRRALCTVEYPTAQIWVLRGFSYAFLCDTAPCASKGWEWQGGGTLTAHKGCTPTQVRLEAALSQREHAVEPAWLYCTPCKCTQFSGGGNWILCLLPT